MTTLPFATEAEGALIARLLIDPKQIPLLADRLAPEDFGDADARAAYSAMKRLAETHTPIDISTINNEAGRTLDIDVRAVTMGHTAPVEEYANLVANAAWRRRFISTLENSAARAYIEDDPQVLLADLQDGVTEIVRGVESGNLISPDQAVAVYERTLEKRATGRGGGLPYGIGPLDHIIQPAQGGNMIVLAARPSIGKTAMAQQIADSWAAAAPHPILFVSLEMGLDELLDRWVSRTANVDPVRGLLNSPDALALAKESAERRRAVRTWFLDDPRATTPGIRAAAAKVKMIADGLSGIVVDYLQLVADQNGGDNEVVRVTRISRGLKAIAREFDVPLLALSQLSRAAEGQPPRLAHLRESGAIEQDADVVLGLYRESLESPETALTILKNRSGSGAGRTVSLWFEAERIQFVEAVHA